MNILSVINGCTHISLDIYHQVSKYKIYNRLKMLRESMYVTQASLVYKTLISTVVLSEHDVSHNNS